jgi:hypothetical protein
LVVEDVFPALSMTRGRLWCGLWSSRRQDLELSVPAGPGFLVPDPKSDYGEVEQYYGFEMVEDLGIRGEDLYYRGRPGKVDLGFEAAQWASSRIRGSWVRDGGGAAEWIAVDGSTSSTQLVNRTERDLSDAWVIDGARYYPIGELRKGASLILEDENWRDEPDSWSSPGAEALWRSGVTAPEGRVGLVDVCAGSRPFLVALATPTSGAPDIKKFKGVDTSSSLLRVPLTRPPTMEETP